MTLVQCLEHKKKRLPSQNEQTQHNTKCKRKHAITNSISGMSDKNLWTEDCVLLGKLLLAVEEMQSFRDNWTSAQARHQSLPTSGMHFHRAQIRHSSMLAVHARPVPEDGGDIDVDIYMRRKRLSEAWELMRSVDGELWTEVCQLYSMVKAVQQNPELFKDEPSVLEDVEEAKLLMRNAEILAAVETIESFRQEEWSNEQASTAIRHGSELTTHISHRNESVIESKVRHAEHANAWQTMKTEDKVKWAMACLYHEEVMKELAKKKEMLDAAVWVIQDFNSKNWTSAHLEADEDPQWRKSQIRHGSTLAVHETSTPDADDPVYHAHRERMVEAWKVMKTVGSKEWTDACKAHEDLVLKAQKTTPFKVSDPGSFKAIGGPSSFQGGVIRKHPPVKNSVNGIAA